MDTTDTVERKVAALMSHKSQLPDPEAVTQRVLTGARAMGEAGRVRRGPLRRALPGHPHPLIALAAGDPWLVVQHVAFEGPGSIAPAIGESGADLTIVRMDRGDAIPPPAALADVAGLIVMGGPMGVHEDLDWLADERVLLRAAVEDGRPVLGVCLGAQQLAAALGASVVPGPAPEEGVGEVHLTRDALSDPVFGPAPTPLPCIHWHGDTFGLPDGAVHLAGNDAYENQAFRIGARAYGLQFHVEVTASLVAHWGPHLPARRLPARLRCRPRRPHWRRHRPTIHRSGGRGHSA